MIKDFLEAKGFCSVVDDRHPHGPSESQTIHAVTPAGKRLAARVKLCWRRRDEKTYSAAQLLASVKNNDWEGTLESFVNRLVQSGATHMLFIQRDDNKISSAALVPLNGLLTIWCSQRDISNQLITQGKMGRRKKNHAMNGSSPTIWLADEIAPSVTSALWDFPEVIDIAKLTDISPKQTVQEVADDTFEDLPGLDISLIGTDGAIRTVAERSYVKRDPRVRAAVLKRANGSCERPGCGNSRQFAAFLDVHHIFGIEKSDRPWTCVAICPNCHREAHFSPLYEQINDELLEVAQGHALM
jgi:5-methylcytosine-specific restriction protein A